MRPLVTPTLRARRGAVVLLASALLLTGCGGDDSEGTDAPDSSAAASSDDAPTDGTTDGTGSTDGATEDTPGGDDTASQDAGEDAPTPTDGPDLPDPADAPSGLDVATAEPCDVLTLDDAVALIGKDAALLGKDDAERKQSDSASACVYGPDGTALADAGSAPTLGLTLVRSEGLVDLYTEREGAGRYTDPMDANREVRRADVGDVVAWTTTVKDDPDYAAFTFSPDGASVYALVYTEPDAGNDSLRAVQALGTALVGRFG